MLLAHRLRRGYAPTSAPGGGVSGNASQTLAGVTQSATGQVAIKGTAAQSLAGVSQTATGQVGTPGLTANVLDQSGATASGASVLTPSISVTAGRKAYIAIAGNRNTAASPLTITGAGQTWAQVGSQVGFTANTNYHVDLFEAVVTTGGTGQLTIVTSQSGEVFAWVIFELIPEAGTVISIGGQDNSTEQTSTTAPSDAVSAPGTGNYLLSLCAKGNDGNNYSGLVGTPRASWLTIGQHSRVVATYGAFVFVQLSPKDGDTTASASGLNTGTYRLSTFAITVSVSGGINGNAAQTLGGVSQTGAGQVAIKGTAAQALAGVTQTATGQVGGGAGIAGNATQTLAGVTQTATGRVAITGTGFAILQGIVQAGAGSVISPAVPPFDWAPPVDLATSAIIGQALRFMRQAPIARIDPSAEILPALSDAYARSMDHCLEASDWSFASTFAVLASAALPEGAVGDDTMPHAFHLPGDLIAIRRVGSPATRWRSDAAMLLADTPAPLTIRYTARVTTEAALPATYQTAIALMIASQLGARWAGATIAADDLAQKAMMTLKQAMREDSRMASPARALATNDLGYGHEADSASQDWAHEAMT